MEISSKPAEYVEHDGSKNAYSTGWFVDQMMAIPLGGRVVILKFGKGELTPKLKRAIYNAASVAKRRCYANYEFSRFSVSIRSSVAVQDNTVSIRRIRTVPLPKVRFSLVNYAMNTLKYAKHLIDSGSNEPLPDNLDHARSIIIKHKNWQAAYPQEAEVYQAYVDGFLRRQEAQRQAYLKNLTSM